MKILVLNASPKGKNSATVHTALYLQALHPEHEFTFLPVGQRIKAYEKDFSPVRAALEQAELVLFCYPVYTFIAPYQLHRLIELIKADGVDLTGKFASQITTSKHFYDVTAHRYVEENCCDLGMKVIRGLSADMEDLLTEQGQKDARNFFDQLMFSCEHGPFVVLPVKAPARQKSVYQPVLPQVDKDCSGDVVIVTNCAENDENLANMIADFRAALPCESRVVNLRQFPFDGGCLGCFGCAVTGKCVYKDGFDDFLRNTIQTADGFVYAFTIADHYTQSSFKCFDDRQFCNGHRTVTHGTPIAYLVSGDYQYEPNLRMILEGRAEVGGNYLCGVATDEGDTAREIRQLAENLAFAMDKKLTRPANFYGVGGMKIFRDLIYVMQGLMKADHKFYKQQGIYDFPQKQKKQILQMKLVGTLLAVPSIQKQAKGKMTEAIVGPYRKVIEQVQGGKK
ncbi:NAD(P)H-dependent oxidoreductase [Allofournierella massiliensis]|uniref:NAD(P)H-dependent oxidoreductase n=1 Tax=Allofournierella massiliensis TaxID=1650663 RepID=A0ABT7UT45_9FIRM|nr:NAD(P)H-dependent oxidoreductase [Fournierella massiliensis]MDM8201910.1 NAD(P)H-dependent oxidoreductase [Fournierella massiliensis]